ncbi:MAG: type I glutamate--ammonia ligase [Lachnospiraceae bacterium]|nr:type I glutamate--ammonia ligase [Lachnospiraceae bacterium]
MSQYTRDDIIRMMEEEDVEFIRLQFTDMFGNLKNLAVTTSQLHRVLDNQIMFDGASIDGFARVEESDMFLYPDLDTFCIFPWRPQHGKVARFICDVYRADGTPFEADPRYVLKQTIKEVEKMGYQFDVGPECEFFLFHSDDEGNPTTITHEKAGYFDVSPQDLGENARRDMILTLEDMGFVIESSHHESAPAQHEIDFQYQEALKAADGIMTFKLAVRTVAKRHGLHASFMPKPKPDVNGSGMHMNMSLSRDGRNVFYDPEDACHLSQEGYWFIGGIMKHIRAITAITNPIVNSYKRLVPGFEAPVYIAWSSRNRSPLIRIPSVQNGKDQRIELRSPDSSANPYLAIAVCLAAGLEGIRNHIDPPESMNTNIFAMTEEEREAAGIECLPGNLLEAIHDLEQDEFIRSVLGEHLSEYYIRSKKKEWADYCAYVTNWEIEHYLAKI